MQDLSLIPRTLLGRVNSAFYDLIRSKHNFVEHSYASGREFSGWKIPQAWEVDKFEVLDVNGRNLMEGMDPYKCVVHFSESFVGEVSKEELFSRLHSIPDMPTATPYKTSYYARRWGFSIPFESLNDFEGEKFRVNLETRFYDSELVVFDEVVEGQTSEEIVFYSYYCHPYMANDNNSGVSCVLALARWLEELEGNHRFSYRFILAPETIGAIAYLDSDFEHLRRAAKAVFVLSNIGDNGPFSVISTAYDSYAVYASQYAWPPSPQDLESYSWRQRGSDERQFGAPNIELPVATLCRSKFGEFREYHTFEDNQSFVSKEGINDSIEGLMRLIRLIEADRLYKSSSDFEPKLSHLGLYPETSVRFNHEENVRDLTTFVSLCNGKRGLFEVLSKAEITSAKALTVLESALDNKLVGPLK